MRPRAYDLARYEAGWARNPFTLKTAPPPSAGAAFARDMAIGAYFGSTENPTVVLVNTKTNERLHLKRGETSPGGITLQNVSLGFRRSDCMVEVRGMGGETAQLRFDEHYLNQLAANAVKKAPPSVAPSQPAPPSAAPARSLNRTSASSIGSPRGAQTGGAGFVPVIPAALQGILPPSAFAAAPAEAAPTSPPSQEGGQTTASPGGFVSPPLHRRRSISAVRF